MAAAEIILLLSALLLVYTYIAYPVITLLIAHFHKSRKTVGDYFPTLSILMPVYNEEKVIGKKIECLLRSDYPPEKIEILAGSDASDDSTDTVILSYAGSDARIKLIRSAVREGKAAVLNRLAAAATGEILVVTDANVMPAPDCLRKVVSHFSDEKTGLCDATPLNTGITHEGIARQEEIYSSFEMRLKNSEAKAWGTSINPYGGFYAIRKSLFPPIPAHILADDLFVGLSLVKKSFRAINDDTAVVYEDIPSGIKEQLRRRIRIAAGSFQNLFLSGIAPGGIFSAASFCFFSHKVLRWFTPLFFIAFFMTSIILSGHSLLYFALALVQVFFLLLPALDFLLSSVKMTVEPFRSVTQFMMMNVALTAGFFRCLKGVKSGVWRPTKRV